MVRSQALDSRKSGDPGIVKLVYSTVGRSPENPSAVFKENTHEIAGQAFRLSIMVHNVSMHTKDAFAVSTNPKTAVAIEAQGEDRIFASIEGGGHEGSDGTFLEFCKP